MQHHAGNSVAFLAVLTGAQHSTGGGGRTQDSVLSGNSSSESFKSG